MNHTLRIYAATEGGLAEALRRELRAMGYLDYDGSPYSVEYDADVDDGLPFEVDELRDDLPTFERSLAGGKANTDACRLTRHDQSFDAPVPLGKRVRVAYKGDDSAHLRKGIAMDFDWTQVVWYCVEETDFPPLDGRDGKLSLLLSLGVARNIHATPWGYRGTVTDHGSGKTYSVKVEDE